MRTALCALILCGLTWHAPAQPSALPSSSEATTQGTPISLFNLPVTEEGYVIALPESERTLSAVSFTIRPETATVFGFHLASPAADSLFTVSYDLVSQQVRVGGSGVTSAFTRAHPLVNNALHLQLVWSSDAAALTVDGAAHHLKLTEPVPAATTPSFFADAGMVQVTHFSAWYAD